MANNQYLRKQGNVWYVELNIPLKIRQEAQNYLRATRQYEWKVKCKFSKSLCTTNLLVARKKRHTWLAYWQRILLEAESGNFESCIFGSTARKKILCSPMETDRLSHDKFSVDLYCDEWLQEHRYARSTEYAASIFIRGPLTSRFKTFDKVSPETIREWFVELQSEKNERMRSIGIAGLRRRLNFMRLYFRFCWDRGYISREIELPQSILPKTSKTRAVSSSNNRSFRPYDIEECKMLLFSACSDGHLDLGLAILLGMHTGMRLGEICSLKVSSCTSHSISVLDSKTYSGRRVIPIHSQILGIYRQVLQSSQDEFFISGLSRDNLIGDRSKGLGRKFARMKSKLNFGRFYGFHSFRSTVATQLEDAGVPEIYAARLLGHKVSTITYGVYSGQSGIEKVTNAVNVLNYQFSSEERQMLNSHFFADCSAPSLTISSHYL